MNAFLFCMMLIFYLNKNEEVQLDLQHFEIFIFSGPNLEN